MGFALKEVVLMHLLRRSLIRGPRRPSDSEAEEGKPRLTLLRVLSMNSVNPERDADQPRASWGASPSEDRRPQGESEKPPEPEGPSGFSSRTKRAALLPVNQGYARLIKKRTPSTIKTTRAMPTIPSPPMPAAIIAFLLLSDSSPGDSQAKTGHDHREHQRRHRPDESRGLTQLLPQGVGALLP